MILTLINDPKLLFSLHSSKHPYDNDESDEDNDTNDDDETSSAKEWCLRRGFSFQVGILLQDVKMSDEGVKSWKERRVKAPGGAENIFKRANLVGFIT